MSNLSLFGGTNLVYLIIIFGFLGLFIEPLFLIAFIAFLGYYLYKLEKRFERLEGGGVRAGPPPKQ